MPQFMRLQRADDAPADGPLVFTASTPGTKRDGYDTAALPWRTDNYRNNPIVTWVHDFAGNRLPIGRAEIEVTGGKRGKGDDAPEAIRAAITFDPDDDFAQEVERKYRSGFLHAVSVSWDDVDSDGVPTRASGGDPVAHDLLEIAAVPVPGDPAALLERQAVALRSLARDISDVLDDGDQGDEEWIDGEYEQDGRVFPIKLSPVSYSANSDGPRGRTIDDLGLDPDTRVHIQQDNEPADDDEGLERDVAAEMVAVFAQGTDDSDSARLRKYRALQPAYRRLGWTAPEFVGRDELDALDDETWRALFLHDEPDLIRAGKVLSARNKADLTQAVKLIRSVLDTAGGMDDEDDDDEGERAVVEPDPEPEHQASDVDAFARILAELAQETTDNE